MYNVRTSIPSHDHTLISANPSYVDASSPLSAEWIGWYLTGIHGKFLEYLLDGFASLLCFDVP